MNDVSKWPYVEVEEWPYLVLFPKEYPAERVEAVLAGRDFRCVLVCHIGCVPRFQTNGYASSGYSLLGIVKSTPDEIEAFKDIPCNFCGKL